MDRIDAKLLEILVEDSSKTATDLKQVLNLSIPAINKRIAKLKKAGIIERFTVCLNAKKLNKTVAAFILLVVDQYSQVNELIDTIQNDPDVVDCYAITGEYDYLIKVYATDIEALEEKLLNFKAHKCVAKSHTIFALMEHKHMPSPLPGFESKIK